MGVLAPLFLAGFAGLALPVVFHLVRRVPRGKQPFSSLMFLSPTPPRLTRRSRLDQWLLLLLRMLALAALALAFARPFLRESALLTLNDLPSRRVALLLDASASMRRDDVWRHALEAAARQLEECSPRDQVALYVYSDRLQTIVPFAGPGGSDGATGSSLASRDIVRQALAVLQPTWSQGDLGASLSALAGELDVASDVEQSLGEPRIVLISDLARGTKLDALQAFEWPAAVRVTAVSVASPKTTNATVHLVNSDEDDDQAEPRVRIVNSADSARDQFQVRWSGGTAPKTSVDGTTVYVPPGQSRVVRLARPADNLQATYIELTGDDHDFDNRSYVVPPLAQQAVVVYAGDDGESDAQGAQFFLRSAVADDPLRIVRFVSLDEAVLAPTNPDRPALVVVTKSIDPSLAAALRRFVESGGTVLAAPDQLESAKSLVGLVDGVALIDPQPRVREGDFALLGQIDFTHPSFQPFASPRYSDFTKIHFWRHVAVTVAADSPARAIARFDDRTPWMLEQTLGKGRVVMLTCGWRPDDSQFAVSSKFLPFVGALLDVATGAPPPLGAVSVGGSIPLAKSETVRRVRKPSGQIVEAAAAEERFTGADEPGLYELTDGDGVQRFAVNLSLSESETSPLELERLEQWGVRMGVEAPRDTQLQKMRQQQDVELESRQQVWRWLLVLCLGFLVVETFWGGIAGRMRPTQEVVT
ncbi:MAG: BatA domain-containing protein [Pirellulales bacterium]